MISCKRIKFAAYHFCVILLIYETCVWGLFHLDWQGLFVLNKRVREGIMGKVKKIALVTSTSNFERYRNVVTAVHRKLKEMGGYALYVLTCYGLFTEKSVYDRGEESIYSLLKAL